MEITFGTLARSESPIGRRPKWAHCGLAIRPINGVWTEEMRDLADEDARCAFAAFAEKRGLAIVRALMEVSLDGTQYYWARAAKLAQTGCA